MLSLVPDPPRSEVLIQSRALNLLIRQVSRVERPGILDLGAPCKTNVDYLCQFTRTLHFGDLFHSLADDLAMSGPEEEERDIEDVVERLIVYEDSIRFDVIFAWNLFDYLDAAAVRAIARRLGRHCRTGTLLHLVTSNQKTIPDQPGRFSFGEGDDLRLRFSRADAGSRTGRQYSAHGLGRLLPGFRLRHSFLLPHDMQDYLFTYT